MDGQWSSSKLLRLSFLCDCFNLLRQVFKACHFFVSKIAIVEKFLLSENIFHLLETFSNFEILFSLGSNCRYRQSFLQTEKISPFNCASETFRRLKQKFETSFKCFGGKFRVFGAKRILKGTIERQSEVLRENCDPRGLKFVLQELKHWIESQKTVCRLSHQWKLSYGSIVGR